MTNVPSFRGYQILGDSQLVRFSRRFLNYQQRKSNGDNSSALCVGGQNMEDLLRRIREYENQINEKLILMIGTNDVLQNADLEKMSFFMDRILIQLIKDGARKIILMTIPPIPKLEKSRERWKTLKKFNEFIKNRHNGHDIFVIDAYAKFIKKSPEKIELKPFGLSQHVNRIDSNFNGTAVMPSMKNQSSSSEDDMPSFTIQKYFDESKTWFHRNSYVYNPLSDYTCDNNFSDELKYSPSPDKSKRWLQTHSHVYNSPSDYTNANNFSDESNGWKNYTYNPLSDYTCDTNFSADVKDDSDNSSDDAKGDSINIDYFERYIDRNNTKKDLIHLNNRGLEQIMELIERHCIKS